MELKNKAFLSYIPNTVIIFRQKEEDLVWFYGISNIAGYLMQNLFYSYKQFYFKQFSFS